MKILAFLDYVVVAVLVFLFPVRSTGAAVAPPSAVYSCSSHRDCSLNGLCDFASGVCQCDAAWSGDDCGVLQLLPAMRGSGFNYSGIGTSSWGGRIIDDPTDKEVFHLFVAVMEYDCPLNNWVPNSKIVHAISYGSIAGPYSPVQDILPTFHHNPTIIFNPFAVSSSSSSRFSTYGRYLLYCIGSETVIEPYDCRNGDVYPAWPGWPVESGVMLYSADSLWGPWDYHGYVLGNGTDTSWDVDTTNPTPLMLNNGSLLLMYRGCLTGWGPELIGLAYTDNPYEPQSYKRLYDQPIFPNPNEDPFIYQDRRGNFHALFHSVEVGGGFGGPNIGRHAFTDDASGVYAWQYNNRTLAFNVTVHFTDGSVIDYYRRERPQLYFNPQTGEPMYLISGVQEKGTPNSYTLIQPIQMKQVQSAAEVEQEKLLELDLE